MLMGVFISHFLYYIFVLITGLIKVSYFMLLASLKLCFHGLYLPNWTPGVQWISRLNNCILDLMA